jgi:acyl-CoA thioesterase I
MTMNPIILALADGTLFFAGMVLVCLADLLLLCFRSRALRPVFTVAALLGLLLVVISSTPLSLWVYALWSIPAVGALLLGNLGKSPRQARITAGVLLLLVTAGLGWTEARWRCLPAMVVPAGTTVYVLGDSLSAGMGTADRCWPAALGELTHLPVVNLAEPGATVHSAMQQAQHITKPGSIVIVEIGGNDLLGGGEADLFRSRLDSLISSLRSNQHDVLMLELPLLPFHSAFGRAQRDIAARYGIALLPKRCLTEVLGLEDGTLDGLHLSQAGHSALAATIAGVLEIDAGRTTKPLP